MPLHVDIRINETVIAQVHIGRTGGTSDEDSINTYRAVKTEPYTPIDFWADDSVEFTHRYGDGALACAQKALTLLDPTRSKQYKSEVRE